MRRWGVRRGGKKESSLDDVSECSVIWFCERRKGEEYCVWFEFVEEFLVVVHESSYMDLFSYCELWDLIRFWYRVENAWWLFSNVVSLTWLRNMMMGTKELEILTDTRFQRWNFCSNCLVSFHFESFFLRLLIFFFLLKLLSANKSFINLLFLYFLFSYHTIIFLLFKIIRQ